MSASYILPSNSQGDGLGEREPRIFTRESPAPEATQPPRAHFPSLRTRAHALARLAHRFPREACAPRRPLRPPGPYPEADAPAAPYIQPARPLQLRTSRVPANAARRRSMVRSRNRGAPGDPAPRIRGPALGSAPPRPRGLPAPPPVTPTQPSASSQCGPGARIPASPAHGYTCVQGRRLTCPLPGSPKPRLRLLLCLGTLREAPKRVEAGREAGGPRAGETE
ncbi:hypothetical protein P7K49_037621 [Saguinus oedipus]|uniref:Uncharacterized protein n=1 Tax=Saguinus oedipus TaxID=9490 RepID=A0ABQ9TIK4_SAGOE|nr:hypothetical protein P7K49_037621 [Saguinus oedipus]